QDGKIQFGAIANSDLSAEAQCYLRHPECSVATVVFKRANGQQSAMAVFRRPPPDKTKMGLYFKSANEDYKEGSPRDVLKIVAKMHEGLFKERLATLFAWRITKKQTQFLGWYLETIALVRGPSFFNLRLDFDRPQGQNGGKRGERGTDSLNLSG